MKTLIISASSRQQGTINTACKSYMKKAEQNNHQTEFINLFDYSISPCTGCLGCIHTKQCVISDDFDTLLEKMQNADHIVLAAPIIFHNVPGILKTFMDRCCSSIIPYVNVDENANMRTKLKAVQKYQNEFKQNGLFKGKTFTTISACATPGNNNTDMKAINTTFKQFIQEEMKGKITEDIRFTDTLFKFKSLSIDDKVNKLKSVG